MKVATGCTMFKQAHNSRVFFLQLPTPARFTIKHFSYQASNKGEDG
jgi:hypothetical protein